jgi:FtsX-like permease family protein/MacB-like protein
MVSTNGSPVPLQVGLDSRLLAFAAAVCSVTGVLFGLVPAWRSARLDMASALWRTQSSAGRIGRIAMSRLLVVGQVALSLVLLVGAGFTAVTFSHNGLLQNRDGENDLGAEDSTTEAESQVDRVGPRYFTTLGIPLVTGRDFDERDTSAPPTAIVINEAMARFYFPGANPIGKRLLVGNPPEAWEIVGEVRTVKQHGPRDAENRRFYRPMFARSDEPDPVSIRFLVRTAADPAATLGLLESAVRAEDKTQPVISATVTDLLNRTIVQERTIATLSTALGVLGVTLACVGLYGLMAYRVVRRTGEIGDRMALGARRSHVLWMILREDLALVLAGVAFGLPVALGASGLTRSLLFGLSATDLPTLAVAAVAMFVIGGSAGLVPAWRATQVEPAVVLRHD